MNTFTLLTLFQLKRKIAFCLCLFMAQLFFQNISHAQCDLIINEVTTNRETCPGTNDGRLTIDATSSNTSEYSIDNGATFLPNPTFIDLEPNTYDIVVRDATDNTCVATTSATVGVGLNSFMTTCPSNIVQNSDAGVCGAVINFDAPTANSSCGVATVTQTDGTGLTIGSLFPVGTTLLTYSLDNGFGGTVNCQVEISIIDIDSDNDGFLNCEDLCPETPNNIDSDADGICDDSDICFGTDNVDDDNDGVCNSLDACPGGDDMMDTDGDNTPDFCDGCPDDPNKTEAGICGCGEDDSLDTDEDGTIDCLDGCPDDPNKTQAGICGCGVPEVDTDGDGFLDCADQCPNDPNNADIDGDGICDDIDVCFGLDNVDDDGDKVCNSLDQCPGEDDRIDTDGDNAPDCVDNCPLDPNKTEPGVCGCGEDDSLDSDGDFVADCVDLCPLDPNKADPGICGCGVPDTDEDNDGIPDCEDPCDNRTTGMACDDNNPNTTNDVIQLDCTCAGTPTELTIDCPDAITVTATSGQGAIVSFEDATAFSTCNVICEPTPQAGFNVMGSFRNSTYYISSQETQWPNAKVQAEAIGGHLVVINDALENDFITQFANGLAVHIGLTDDGSEGNFYWVNGDPVTYTNWGEDFGCLNDGDTPTNPDNMNPDGLEGANHVLLRTYYCGEWGDYRFNNKKFIVEIPCTESGPVMVNQTQGHPSGSAFATGLNTIEFTAIDECQNVETCSFDINVLPCADDDNDGVCNSDDLCEGFDDSIDVDNDDIPDGCDACITGTACDDGDVCTTGDVYDENCMCAGTFQDADNDGVCDANDDCDNTLIGTACDDGDVCTTGDVYDENCMCAGTFQDADNDGVCDANDDCDNALIGTACDDGDVCTTGDVYDENCLCAGTFQDADNDGVCDANDDCDNTLIGTACDDGDVCTTGDVYDENCMCAGTFQDADNDGVCDANDDCDAALIGTACDDGDVCTTGDVYDENCLCAGTFQDADNDGVCDANDDCDNTLIGTACDDGDPNTINDQIQDDCSCQGLPNNSDLTLICPMDITVDATSVNGAMVQFDVPTGFTTCAISGGGQTCDDITFNTNQYEDLGTFNGSRYLLSKFKRRWSQAQNFAENFDEESYLVSINSAAENAFLANQLDVYAHIGYSDFASEGNFAWTDNSTGTYTNLGSNWNNTNSRDFAVMEWWSGNGTWETVGQWTSKYFIVEIPCSGGGSEINISQTNGAASGNTFAVGSHYIAFEAEDACGNMSTCNFLITVTAGEICDGIDNNNNGEIDENLSDTDNDGVCDDIDQCPGFDDFVDKNNNGIPDGCEEGGSASVGNQVFDDKNNNGLHDNGEPGITDVFIALYQNNEFIDYRYTDNNGMYLFDNLEAGLYQIKFANPNAGYEPVPQDVGTNESKDSDADFFGNTDVFELQEGESNLDIDAGFHNPNVGVYCASSGHQPWQQYLSNVTFGSINNTSGKSQYSDFKHLVTDLETKSTMVIALTPKFSYYHYNEYFRVWIDYNQDVDFEDANELVFEGIYDAQTGIAGQAANPVIGEITIPDNIPMGTTRMRIAMKKGAYPTACEAFQFGEVEDYSVNIIPGSNAVIASQALNLQAYQSGQNVKLQWGSNTGFKTDRFEIERSADGLNFEHLATQDNVHWTDRMEFFLETDEQPLLGENVYRIKKVHLDGSFEYSNLPSVRFNIDLADFILYPNPAQEKVTIGLNPIRQQAGTIQVYNVFGQLMFEQTWDALPEQVDLDIQQYLNGVYTVFIQPKKGQSVGKKLVVQRMD